MAVRDPLLLATYAVGGSILFSIPSVFAIVTGLAIVSTGVFAARAASQGYFGVARERRSTAAALYLAVYYAGGGLGAVLPAAVWTRGGWPATVALVVAVQLVAVALAAAFWTRSAPLSRVLEVRPGSGDRV